jgi:hypothetical protein
MYVSKNERLENVPVTEFTVKIPTMFVDGIKKTLQNNIELGDAPKDATIEDKLYSMLVIGKAIEEIMDENLFANIVISNLMEAYFGTNCVVRGKEGDE